MKRLFFYRSFRSRSGALVVGRGPRPWFRPMYMLFWRIRSYCGLRG